jgi:septal ring factor EnvC (AmiA/AmiB activator)
VKSKIDIKETLIKNIVSYCIFLFIVSAGVYGQSRADLEGKRNKALEDIKYVDNLLKETSKEKKQGINAVKIIGNKLVLRESIISSMRQEIDLLKQRIELDTIAIDMMVSDLGVLKEDYRKAVLRSYKLEKGNPEIFYILSAKDFNQGYKRLKYLQQITKFRRRQAEIIQELKEQIEQTKERLENDLLRVSDLKNKEERQKEMLQGEQKKMNRMVQDLGNKERQLKKELEEKKRIAREIEREIAKLIEAEKRRAVKKEISPEQRLIGENFEENKGRLPWPVDKGIITSHFGVHKHPVLKYLTEDNIGIEITSSGKVYAKSIFKGEVAKVFAISGANMTVIIKHGKFMSVYANLVNVKVKAGEKVETGQVIGEVFSDPVNNNNSILKFMIFESKYLDPEQWIFKN